MDRNLAVEGRTCCEKCLREAAHPFQAEMSHQVQSQEAATQPLLWFTKECLPCLGEILIRRDIQMSHLGP